MSSYFCNAGVLFLVAKKAAKNAADEVAQGALIATIFSVVSAEAFINEAVEMASDLMAEKESDPERVTAFAELEKQIEDSRGSLELKYQIAKWVFTGKGFDTGAEPYQSFALLIDTRNALIHSKMLDKYNFSSVGMTLVSPIKVLDRLRSKNVTRDVPDHVGVSWLYKVNTPAMANWACDVARAMVREIAAIPPDGVFKSKIGMLAKSFEVELA